VRRSRKHLAEETAEAPGNLPKNKAERQAMQKVKKIPQRQCVGCREMKDKKRSHPRGEGIPGG
jgi:hypothetical protein